MNDEARRPKPPPAPGPASPPTPAPERTDGVTYRCDICGAPMMELHCRIICNVCGYQRDCSDP